MLSINFEYKQHHLQQHAEDDDEEYPSEECVMTIEGLICCVKKRFIPMFTNNDSSQPIYFCEHVKFNSDKFQQFIDDLRNNNDCFFAFNDINGFDGFNYKDGIFTIVTDDQYGPKLSMDIYIESETFELYNQLESFKNWVIGLTTS